MPFKKNEKYSVILEAKGENYLRGWARFDASVDPKGAAIRMAHFNKNK